jgi:hypothetical protein
MEYWNVGFGGLRSNLIPGYDQKLKLEKHPLFDTQYSLAQTDYTKFSFY